MVFFSECQSELKFKQVPIQLSCGSGRVSSEFSKRCEFKQARLWIACEGTGDSMGGRAHSPLFLSRCGPRSRMRVQVFVRMLGHVLVRRYLERVSALKKMNAWICASQKTDRDLDSSNTMRRVNAWICAPRTTDRDPASVIPDQKRKSVTTVI